MAEIQNKYLWQYYKDLLENASKEKYILTKNIILKTLLDDVSLISSNRKGRWSKERDIQNLSYILAELSRMLEKEKFNKHNESILLSAISLIYQIKTYEYAKKSKPNRQAIRRQIELIKRKLEGLELE